MNAGIAGSAVGLVSGLASGLLGVSPGGPLVTGLALGLDLEQHRAQAISLAAQLLPAGFPGVLAYHSKGHTVPWRWVAVMSLGFLVGSYGGAVAAGLVSERVLRWAFVGYLLLLAALVAFRKEPPREAEAPGHGGLTGRRALALTAVGIASGLSAGFLGIGGGLAMTVLMVGAMRLPQHQSQAMALAVTTLPTGLPAVWVYAKSGEGLPWGIVALVVAGLLLGTWAGARWATALPAVKLRRLFIGLVLTMAAVMIAKALA